MSEFNLKAVLRQTGLSPETLRAWERRYGVVTPSRTSTGRRLYTSTEVQRLCLLSTLVHRGFRIGDIAYLSDLELTERVEKSATHSHGSISKLSSKGISDLIQALDHFDLDDLKKKWVQVRYQLSAKEMAFELVPAVLSRVGQLILENRFSVAEEHALSLLIKNELQSIYQSLLPLDGVQSPIKKMIFLTREGDHHEIGLMLAAIQCRSFGLQCEYLGVNYPVEAVKFAASKTRPFAVVTGLSFLPSEEEKISPNDFLKKLDQCLPKSIELWVGGSAVNALKRPKSTRSIWIFESLKDLESKLSSLLRS